MIDLVCVWCDARYWSKILRGTVPTIVHYLKVKDLVFVCLSFALHFLGPHSFQILQWIWFMCGKMIDTGPEFCMVPFPS